jgi:hypothetical protein
VVALLRCSVAVAFFLCLILQFQIVCTLAFCNHCGVKLLYFKASVNYKVSRLRHATVNFLTLSRFFFFTNCLCVSSKLHSSRTLSTSDSSLTFQASKLYFTLNHGCFCNFLFLRLHRNKEHYFTFKLLRVFCYKLNPGRF